MHVQFIVSIVGPDRFGLPKHLASATHELGGKWLNSKVIRLGGQFAALIRVEVPAVESARLRAVFAGLEGCHVVFSDVRTAADAATRTCSVTVDAEDRPGLVSDITHLLQEHQVTIQDMQCHRMVAAGLGTSMFRGEFDVAVPGGVDLSLLMSDLEALGEHVMVSVDAAAPA